MKLDRRSFIKTNAIAATAVAAGITITGFKVADATSGINNKIRWDKAACRFCGTGCSVLVGTKDGRVVATQGDPDSPVNRGLICIKGYFLSKIMYGKDRLTKPLLRMTWDDNQCNARIFLSEPTKPTIIILNFHSLCCGILPRYGSGF